MITIRNPAKIKANAKSQSTKLTSRQETFAQHYALHADPEAAYQAARYATSRLSPETLRRRAAKVAAHRNVKARVAQLKVPIAETTIEQFDRGIERLLAFHCRVAFFDIADYVSWGANWIRPRPLNELTPEQLSVIKRVTITQGRTQTIRIELHDRMKSLKALAKCLGFFDKVKRHATPQVLVFEYSEDANL